MRSKTWDFGRKQQKLSSHTLAVSIFLPFFGRQRGTEGFVFALVLLFVLDSFCFSSYRFCRHFSRDRRPSSSIWSDRPQLSMNESKLLLSVLGAGSFSAGRLSDCPSASRPRRMHGGIGRRGPVHLSSATEARRNGQGAVPNNRTEKHLICSLTRKPLTNVK